MWDGDKLTIYEESQGVLQHARRTRHKCSVCRKRTCASITKFVRLRFLAANFGRGHIVRMAAVAAARSGRQTGQARVLAGRLTFQSARSSRPILSSVSRLGATPEGKLVSLEHDYVCHRSMLEEYQENCGEATAFHYSFPNLRVHFGLGSGATIGTAKRYAWAPGAVPAFTLPRSAMNTIGRPAQDGSGSVPHPE